MSIFCPVEFHGPRIEALEEHVQKLAEELARLCPKVMACIVQLAEASTGWKMGVEVVLPPRREVTLSRTTTEDDPFSLVNAVFRDLFQTVQAMATAPPPRRPAQAVGVVLALYRNHGYLRTIDGSNVVFHRESLQGWRFEELRVGMGVSFTESEPGQASQVEVRSSSPSRPRRNVVRA